MEKEKSDPLLCFLCNNKFKRPKILNCLHSYCEKCLQRMQKSSKLARKDIRCPVCREATPVENGVEGIKTNFFLGRLVEDAVVSEILWSKSAIASCELCEREAVCRCYDCARFLCSCCRAIHDRLPASSEHGVWSLDECRRAGATPASGTGRDCPPECSGHAGERCRFYCLSCQKLICRDCTVLDHSSQKSHNYTSLESAACEEKRTTGALVVRLEKKIPQLEAALEVLTEMGPVLKSQNEMARGLVQAAANKIRESVTEAEKRLLREIRLESRQQEKELRENKKEVVALLDDCRFSHDASKFFVQKSKASEFLWLNSILTKKLHDLVAKEAPVGPSAVRFKERDTDISLGTLTKEDITEAVSKEVAQRKLKGKENSSFKKAPRKVSAVQSKEPAVPANKENQHHGPGECGDSEEEISGSSQPCESDEPSTSIKTATSTGHDAPDGKMQSKSSPSGLKTSSADAGARRTKDAIPPSDRVLRSSSKANASQNQAIPRPTQHQQPRASIDPVQGSLTQDVVDGPARRPTIRSKTQGQSGDRLNPSLSAAGSAKGFTTLQNRQPPAQPPSQHKPQHLTHAASATQAKSEPFQDFKFSGDLSAAQLLSSMQQGKAVATSEDGSSTHPHRDGAQAPAGMYAPEGNSQGVNGSDNENDTDSDGSDL
ncbi:E3 ubiquitin-protein ligase TRIM56-like [Acanthaster planci]|uniref:E3 ubiquitin-protein ligase TRIM56-like n=1 Tax=Acanthaster planci TaxID=133434 RepID=A0A8B7Y8C5_ACAPL|nr:E3 ubiquitin-protein ligase TRIM56-like [Acanthaster planci]